MERTANRLEIEIRAATAEDIPLLLSFIHQMAAFEKLKVEASAASLKESLFTERPAAKALIACHQGIPCAYVTYFFTFATMTGRRGLWLDDVFVLPDARGKGIGRALMAALGEIAVRNNCARFEWMVLDWNTSAIDFYRGLGASVLEDWRICRMEEEAFKSL